MTEVIADGSEARGTMVEARAFVVSLYPLQCEGFRNPAGCDKSLEMARQGRGIETTYKTCFVYAHARSKYAPFCPPCQHAPINFEERGAVAST